jgi:hypothetical protein
MRKGEFRKLLTLLEKAYKGVVAWKEVEEV